MMLRKLLKLKLKFLIFVPNSNQNLRYNNRVTNSKNQSRKLLQASNSLRLKYHHYTGKRPNYLQVILQPVSSLLPAVIPWTVFFAAFVGFSLLSIEHVGSESEEPFGYDSNDLPLNAICYTILLNVREIISFTPQSTRQSLTKKSI
jgi:Bestrophin, RFP-TM, chloride channel